MFLGRRNPNEESERFNKGFQFPERPSTPNQTRSLSRLGARPSLNRSSSISRTAGLRPSFNGQGSFARHRSPVKGEKLAHSSLHQQPEQSSLDSPIALKSLNRHKQFYNGTPLLGNFDRIDLNKQLSPKLDSREEDLAPAVTPQRSLSRSGMTSRLSLNKSGGLRSSGSSGGSGGLSIGPLGPGGRDIMNSGSRGSASYSNSIDEPTFSSSLNGGMRRSNGLGGARLGGGEGGIGVNELGQLGGRRRSGFGNR